MVMQNEGIVQISVHKESKTTICLFFLLDNEEYMGLDQNLI